MRTLRLEANVPHLQHAHACDVKVLTIRYEVRFCMWGGHLLIKN